MVLGGLVVLWARGRRAAAAPGQDSEPRACPSHGSQGSPRHRAPPWGWG